MTSYQTGSQNPTASSGNAKVRADAEAVKQDAAAIKDDLRELKDDVARTARSAADAMREQSSHVGDYAQDKLEAAEDAYLKARRQIVRHPAATVLATFAVGVIVGRLTNWR